MRRLKEIAGIIALLAGTWLLFVHGIGGVTVGKLLAGPYAKTVEAASDAFEEAAKNEDSVVHSVLQNIQKDTDTENMAVVGETHAQSEEIAEVKADNEPAIVPQNDIYVEFIDVGQGDSILIVDDSEAMLIDTGVWEAYDNVCDALLDYGINSIDTLVLTHPDADHIQSAPDIIEQYNVQTCYMPVIDNDTASYQYTLDALRDYGVSVIYPTAGEYIDFGTASYEIVGPVYDIRGAYEDTNSYSIVIKMVNGEDSFLFTGDATGEETDDILNAGYDVSADVLKLAHHGSANDGCNSEAFIDSVNPRTMIVSCGYSNDYGHPHIETMALAKQFNCELFRTDLQGSVSCVSTGNGITWNIEPTTVFTNGNGF